MNVFSACADRSHSSRHQCCVTPQEARVQRATIIQNYAAAMANMKELSSGK